MRETKPATLLLTDDKVIFEPEETLIINRAYHNALSYFINPRSDDELWRATRLDLAKSVIEAAKWGTNDQKALTEKAIWHFAGAESKTRPRH